MPSGAVHPNSSNFSRVSRFTIVERVRRLVAQGVYEKRPDWLQFAERAPPMELHNLKLREVQIRSPYVQMVRHVLKIFPDMRFQDCFVDGNDWSVGNDSYRADHPAMQFVARQLQLINSEGLSKQAAFSQTKSEFLTRRKALEDRHKLNMAINCNQRIVPAFSGLYTTGAALARNQEAEIEVVHLNHIRRKLRMLRKEIEPHEKRRMGPKEMALDMELERSVLLPKMPPSKFVPEVTSTPPLIVRKDDTSFSKEGEQFDDEDETASPEKDTMEFSGFDLFEKPTFFEPTKKNSKPREIVSEGLIQPKLSAPLAAKAEKGPRTPTAQLVAEKPVWSTARPDKLTVQSILATKKKFELEKRIGKEPGKEEQLDFEDYMTIINNRKK